MTRLDCKRRVLCAPSIREGLANRLMPQPRAREAFPGCRAYLLQYPQRVKLFFGRHLVEPIQASVLGGVLPQGTLHVPWAVFMVEGNVLIGDRRPTIASLDRVMPRIGQSPGEFPVVQYGQDSLGEL